MTRIISLYNHKGGVSKTSTVFNLGHALVEFEKKHVLLVDGDPQCNLTELCLADVISDLEAEEEFDKDLPGTSVLQALRPRLDGDRADVDVNSIKVTPVRENKNLHLFRGDIALNEAEDKLAYAHTQRLGSDLHQHRNYIAVHDMLRRLGERRGYDYVLVDLGPSAGALTRSFFLACDSFLVPVVPDRFNYQAVGSLSRIITRWISEHAMVVPALKKLGLNVSGGHPTFLGLIMQRFQRHSGAPKPAYKVWIERITERGKTVLVPALLDATAELADPDDVVSVDTQENPVACEIADFASLAPMMLQFGKPPWSLRARV